MLIAQIKKLIATNHGTHRGWIRHQLARAEWLTGRVAPFMEPALAPIQRVVFVCHGNINRSALADAIARANGLNSASFGLSTQSGQPAFEKALRQAPQFGADLTTHRTTDVADFTPRAGDLLLAMEIRHARKLAARFPGTPIALLGQWARPCRLHLHDPHTLSDAYFVTCFTLINSAVANLAIAARQAGAPCVLAP